MGSRKPDPTLLALLARTYGAEPRVVARGSGEPPLEIALLAGYPSAEQTTLVTMGLASAPKTLYRGLPVGFELTATTAGDVAELESRLEAAVVDELRARARGTAHTRVATLPPRGVMYNGVYAAGRAPYLLFAPELTLTPSLAGRKRIGSGWVELLAATPITEAELARYDAGPGNFVADLAKRRG